MRRTIYLIIAVFLVGLITVVAVGTWKLSEIRDTISAERDGTIALYRLGQQASKQVQSLEVAVEALFQARTAADLDHAQKSLDGRLTELTSLVDALAQPRFAGHLNQPSLQPDGSAGPPLQESVTTLTAGISELKTAAQQVTQLATARLDLRRKVPDAKNELSKLTRKTLDLSAVDAKAYNNLVRGVMVVLGTESPSDLNFLGKAKVEEALPKLQAATLSDTQKADLAAFQKQFDSSYEVVRAYISSAADVDHFHHVAASQLGAISTLVHTFEKRFDQGQDILVGTTTTTITTTTLLASGIALFCLIMGVLVASSLTRPLARTVARMSAVTGALTKGDLTARVDAAGHDEVSSMARAINATLDQLRDAMSSIGASVKTLAGRSSQLNDISAKLDDASVNASAMTTELSTTAAQVSQSIQSVSAGIEEFSSGANEIAKTTGEAALIGRQAMEQAKGAEETMSSLAQASQEIGSIIAVIEAITEQTKLLALNATIEAARAGEAGKGFAVVANEVKNLATKTATAAGDIRSQIEAIRRGSVSASSAIAAVAATIAKVNDFQQSIAGAVEEQAATTRELARHLGQAATGGAEIAGGVREVADGAKANSEHARTVLTTAKDLSTTTSELGEFVGRFRY